MVRITRFAANPLISIHTNSDLEGNVNGPSVIEVPEWLPEPKGRFYMYFANHSGKSIRLAYSDDIEGPWIVHEPGTLRLEQAIAFHDHIASPDVHVLDDERRIRLYFHGPGFVERKPNDAGGQVTGISHSSDGISFCAEPHYLGPFYFRVFRYAGFHYALAKNGDVGFQSLLRSSNGVSDWVYGKDFLPNVRHTAVLVEGDELAVVYSRIGDAPEHLRICRIDLRDDWLEWEPFEDRELLLPECDYEGADFGVAPSNPGSATGVRQLRDPAILSISGERYLFYSGAGEETINGARIEL